jgi:hypothetical protein
VDDVWDTPRAAQLWPAGGDNQGQMSWRSVGRLTGFFLAVRHPLDPRCGRVSIVPRHVGDMPQLICHSDKDPRSSHQFAGMLSPLDL